MNDGSDKTLMQEIEELLNRILVEQSRAAEAARQTAPPQTTGQRIAERMVQSEPSDTIAVHDGTAGACYVLRVPGTGGVSSVLRQYIAAAIDKAIADDRAAADDINAAGIAAEREACAKIADNLLLCIECDGRTEQAIKAVKRGIANHIRARP